MFILDPLTKHGDQSGIIDRDDIARGCLNINHQIE
jgi:hypothetical protein